MLWADRVPKHSCAFHISSGRQGAFLGIENTLLSSFLRLNVVGIYQTYGLCWNNLILHKLLWWQFRIQSYPSSKWFITISNTKNIYLGPKTTECKPRSDVFLTVFLYWVRLPLGLLPWVPPLGNCSPSMGGLTCVWWFMLLEGGLALSCTLSFSYLTPFSGHDLHQISLSICSPFSWAWLCPCIVHVLCLRPETELWWFIQVSLWGNPCFSASVP